MMIMDQVLKWVARVTEVLGENLPQYLSTDSLFQFLTFMMSLIYSCTALTALLLVFLQGSMK
jgi:hypothetical protein